jgi:hypothetical protein
MGKLAGCSRADNPILVGLKVRGRLGVLGVVGVDVGVLWRFAAS